MAPPDESIWMDSHAGRGFAPPATFGFRGRFAIVQTSGTG